MAQMMFTGFGDKGSLEIRMEAKLKEYTLKEYVKTAESKLKDGSGFKGFSPVEQQNRLKMLKRKEYTIKDLITDAEINLKKRDVPNESRFKIESRMVNEGKILILVDTFGEYIS